MSAATTIRSDTIGQRLTAVIRDLAGAPVNIGATPHKREIIISLINDAGTVASTHVGQATLTTNGSDGSIYYDTEAGVLDHAGPARYQGRVEFVSSGVTKRLYSPEYEVIIGAAPAVTVSNLRPRMSKVPLPPTLTPDPTTAFVTQWTALLTEIGANGVLTNLDSFAAWAVWRPAVPAFGTNQKLFAQISRTEIGTQSEAVFMANLQAFLTSWGSDLYAINLAVEANDDDYDILGADPGGRRTILNHAVMYVKGRFPNVITTVSFNLMEATLEGNVATCVNNIESIGVDMVSFSEYIDADFLAVGGVDVEGILTARYSPLFGALAADAPFIVAEFAASALDSATAGQGEAVQEMALQRFYNLMIASGHSCRLLNYTFMWDTEAWYNVAFAGHGLRYANGTHKTAGTLWTTQRDLFNG